MLKVLCTAGLAALWALSALSCSYLESEQGSAAVGASDAAAAEAEGRCRNTPEGAAKHYCERMGYRN
jgi:hypothetical protein